MKRERRRTAWPSPEATVITEAGLETWLVFDKGIDLPVFAAYPLVASPEGRALFNEYYEHYVAIAQTAGAALLLETPTWRANPDWAAVLGHDLGALGKFLDASVEMLDALRRGWSSDQAFLIGATVGPRGDGYRVDTLMAADTAADYHAFQVGRMANAGVDTVSALTMGYVDEAVGIAQAAEVSGLPVVISFTVETDGRLPSGMSIGEAITATDEATRGYPTHYMINCAHPTHFAHVLDAGSEWVNRLGGIRANASTASHEELDEMLELDAGDPDDLAARYVALRATLPAMHVIGGCCGTDHRHVAAIASAWTQHPAAGDQAVPGVS
jgi:homocysteine S-methyltransferase